MLFNHNIAGQVFEKIASEQILFALIVAASVDVSTFLLRLAAGFDVFEQGLHLAILDALKLLEVRVTVLMQIGILGVNTVLAGNISVLF